MASNNVLIVATIPLLLLAHTEWIRRVQTTVPQPYLDEFFHIPQADAFWQGRWSHWDDKITTPPGVYLWSILMSKVVWLDPYQSVHLSPYQLRYTNFVLPYLLVICVIAWRRSSGRATGKSWIELRELSIFAFPLFFFFSGLYYTDVFSALTVMCTYSLWQTGLSRGRGFQKLAFQTLHLLSGLLAIACRQTNIFWVAVFTGGLQVVHTIKQNVEIYDPSIEKASFEDFFRMTWSLMNSFFSAIIELVLDIWPHVGLLASFAAFVFWNGGVVLGDKTNHVATIHLPQMLYIWPFILFFSWPVLLPHLTRPRQLLQRLPRLWLIVSALAAITAIVHFNTIVHEFILADNRHYTFYVFKILRTHPWLWYASVPVYAASAWLSIVALGSTPAVEGQGRAGGSQKSKGTTTNGFLREGNRLSFLLVWILSTGLSLITAPLVEPRYFIVPWLIWRLHVSDTGHEGTKTPRGAAGRSKFNSFQHMAMAIASNSVWFELLWCMLINFVTCRMFLEREFRWAHSPSEVQRFMW